MAGLGELAVELAQRLVSWPWSEGEREVEVEQLPGRVAGEAGMVECLLGSVCLLLVAAEVVRDPPEHIPDGGRRASGVVEEAEATPCGWKLCGVPEAFRTSQISMLPASTTSSMRLMSNVWLLIARPLSVKLRVEVLVHRLSAVCARRIIATGSRVSRVVCEEQRECEQRRGQPEQPERQAPDGLDRQRRGERRGQKTANGKSSAAANKSKLRLSPGRPGGRRGTRPPASPRVPRSARPRGLSGRCACHVDRSDGLALRLDLTRESVVRRGQTSASSLETT